MDMPFLGDKGLLFIRARGKKVWTFIYYCISRCVAQKIKSKLHQVRRNYFPAILEPPFSGCSSVAFQGPRNVIKPRSKNGEVWAMLCHHIPENSNTTMLCSSETNNCAGEKQFDASSLPKIQNFRHHTHHCSCISVFPTYFRLVPWCSSFTSAA